MTDQITITLSDGIERVLRYSLATSKKLSKKFGQTLMKGFGDLDETKLGELVWNGLRDAKGNPPADLLTPESIDELIEMKDIPALMRAFADAWRGANTPKNEEGDQPKSATEPAETDPEMLS